MKTGIDRAWFTLRTPFFGVQVWLKWLGFYFLHFRPGDSLYHPDYGPLEPLSNSVYILGFGFFTFLYSNR